ncbi:ATPase [Mycolicibacterium moriokaense]|nr:ATPase [Mycolicibacterium moriokaense]
MTTVDVEVHATIERPRTEVARYCCDPDNAPAWQANIDSVQWETDGPLTLGSRLRFTSGFLGRSLEYTYEVTGLVPAQRLVLRSDQSPFLMETTYTFSDTDEGDTWMTVRSRGDPTAYAALSAPILATAIRRAATLDLARLKTLLEHH